MLGDSLRTFFQTDVAKEALARVVCDAFKAGYDHGECLNEGGKVCACMFCQTADDDPEFARNWRQTLEDAGIPYRQSLPS